MIKKSTFTWCVSKVSSVGRHPVLWSRRLQYRLSRMGADMLAGAGYYNYPHRIIFLAGMAIGGTTKMKQMLASIPGYYVRPVIIPHDIGYNCDFCDQGFDHIPAYGYTLFKTHLNPKQENLDVLFRNGVKKILITYRDLRDVAVSRYYRLIADPKSKAAPNYIDYVALGKEKAMDHSIKIIGKYYVDWIKGWCEIGEKDPGRYLFVKFEEMKRDCNAVFRKVLAFYGIELSEKKIEKGVRKSESKKSLKKNLEEAKILPFGLSTNFRSGKVGQWRYEMTPAHIERCKELMGDVLIELGYEKDLNWEA